MVDQFFYEYIDPSSGTYITAYVLTGLSVCMIIYVWSLYAALKSEDKDRRIRDTFGTMWFVPLAAAALLEGLASQHWNNANDNDGVWKVALILYGIHAVGIWVTLGAVLNPTKDLKIFCFPATITFLIFGVIALGIYIVLIFVKYSWLWRLLVIGIPILVLFIGLFVRLKKVPKARKGTIVGFFPPLLYIIGLVLNGIFESYCGLGSKHPEKCPFTSENFSQNTLLNIFLIVANAMLVFPIFDWMRDPMYLGEGEFK